MMQNHTSTTGTTALTTTTRGFHSSDTTPPIRTMYLVPLLSTRCERDDVIYLAFFAAMVCTFEIEYSCKRTERVSCTYLLQQVRRSNGWAFWPTSSSLDCTSMDAMKMMYEMRMALTVHAPALCGLTGTSSGFCYPDGDGHPVRSDPMGDPLYIGGLRRTYHGILSDIRPV